MSHSELEVRRLSVWAEFALWVPISMVVTSCSGGFSAEELAATILAETGEAYTATPVPPTGTATPTELPTSTVTPSPSATPTPLGGGGKLAFASDRWGQYDIYLIHVDGTELTRLTNSVGDERDPAWSPDGEWVAYLYRDVYRAVDSGIFAQRADGTGKYRIREQGLAPNWNPTGEQLVIAYSRCLFIFCERNQRILYPTYLELVQLNTEGRNRITFSNSRESDPVWSPDGQWIAFTRFLTFELPASSEIYTIPAQGGEEVRITNMLGRDEDPAWSPDGTRIAFASNRNSNFDIFLINEDASGLVQLTDHLSDDINPTWSPDGRMIAFASERRGGFNIYLLDLESGEITRVTNEPGEEVEPDWWGD